MPERSDAAPTATRTLVLVPPCEPCAECTALERAGRDPALRRTTGSLSLYRLVGHHIEVHGTEGAPVDGCARCEDWAGRHGAWITPHLAQVWRRRHYVMHQLGIVWDGAPHPLRFADMPPPRL